MADYDFTTIMLYNVSGGVGSLPGIGAVPGSGVTGGLIDAYDDMPGTATDGESDTTFEIGDGDTLDLEDPTTGDTPFTAQGDFAGTMIVDGLEVPVLFVAASEWPAGGQLATLFPNGGYAIADPRPLSDITVPATLDFTQLDTTPFTVCFLSGTYIATPDGPRAVESLSIGDAILTDDGDTVPVKWLGRQTVTTRFSARRGLPVRIAAGALGPNLPARDLCVTQDHALMIDGLLINAGAMVNGTTVTVMDPADLGDTFTVYHVETEGHRVILAEGAATETFIDYVDRARFDNYDEFVTLYGDVPMVAELDRPRISTARHLPPALRARLGLDRAA